MQIALSNKAFWDMDMQELDKNLHKDFIIVRVFQYGNITDFRTVLKTYTKEEIRQALLNYRGLDTVTRDFARTLNFI